MKKQSGGQSADSLGTRKHWDNKTLALFASLPDEQGSEHSPGSSEHLTPVDEAKLWELGEPVREKPKVSKELMTKTLLSICSEHWLSLRTLARVVGRETDTLRNHYINPMLRDGRLNARVPGKSNHPNQAYRKA